MIRQTQTFIGSSSEGLAVANAIKANLSELTDCRIWTEGVFLPGRTFIETLEKILDEMDYAILLATPDDSLTKRDVENFSMRQRPPGAWPLHGEAWPAAHLSCFAQRQAHP